MPYILKTLRRLATQWQPYTPCLIYKAFSVLPDNFELEDVSRNHNEEKLTDVKYPDGLVE